MRSPGGRARQDLRLPSRHERLLAVLRVRRRRLQIVAQAQVDREARMQFHIVLHEHARLPEIVERGLRRVLVHGHRQSEQVIGEAVPLVCLRSGLGAREAEGAVIIQQRLLDVLRQAQLAAEADGVASAHITDHIADAVHVIAGDRAGDRLAEREVPGDRDLRKIRRSLDVEVASQVVQRDGGQVGAPAEIARVAQPRLVDQRRLDRPRVLHVRILLPPVERLRGPWQVAARQTLYSCRRW